jgi:ABC-type multidrug transport system, ATPase component
MEAVFQECVAEEKRRGRTVLLSSHILAEVEALCDRVSIIQTGRIVETGTLTDLRHLARTSISVELAGPPAGLADVPGVHNLKIDGARVRFEVDNSAIDTALCKLTAIGVRSLDSRPPTLEELFLRHYANAGDRRREAGVSA